MDMAHAEVEGEVFWVSRRLSSVGEMFLWEPSVKTWIDLMRFDGEGNRG